MKKWCVALVIALLLSLPRTAPAAEFTLQSPQLPPGGRMAEAQVFNGFGCSGSNVSPELHWKNNPPGTKSFAVTAYDPDAPTGSGWWHWLIFNIPPEVDNLPTDAGNPASGKAPAGSIQSKTDYGSPGYGGACPPQGDKPHRYIFTVYALNIDKLPLDSQASGAMVGFNLRAHAIGKAEVMVFYSR